MATDQELMEQAQLKKRVVGSHNKKTAEERILQRQQIWALFEQGLGVTEIARRMNCSISNVSNNLRRQKAKRVNVAYYNRATLRDHFAMAAMTGRVNAGLSPKNLAENAYIVADAMMEARNKFSEKGAK